MLTLRDGAGVRPLVRVALSVVIAGAIGCTTQQLMNMLNPLPEEIPVTYACDTPRRAAADSLRAVDSLRVARRILLGDQVDLRPAGDTLFYDRQERCDKYKKDDCVDVEYVDVPVVLSPSLRRTLRADLGGELARRGFTVDSVSTLIMPGSRSLRVTLVTSELGFHKPMLSRTHVRGEMSATLELIDEQGLPGWGRRFTGIDSLLSWIPEDDEYREAMQGAYCRMWRGIRVALDSAAFQDSWNK